ncbi:MAG TPA: YceI family protein [Edaphobacter sp.]|nr:YceI family protein [Edaphobacter sp.]
MSKAIREFRIFLLVSMLVFFTGSNSAQSVQPITVTLDPAATTIDWTLGATMHTVNGTFKLKQGTIQCNPRTGEASGLIEIDATSGESGNSSRDHRMHKSILESDRYQRITFRPVHIEGSLGEALHGDFVVDGIFNLHGQDHPMKLNVSAQPATGGISIKTHFVVPYVQWGIKDPSTFVFRVEKDVSVDVSAVAKTSIASATASHP